MPVYAFRCETCGAFDVMRPMAEASVPTQCPDCGDEARRVFSPPGLALVAKPLRRALDSEEKSAHEPDLVTRKRGRHMPHAHDPSPPWVLAH
jgi:putative FmdB family regulatory protein